MRPDATPNVIFSPSAASVRQWSLPEDNTRLVVVDAFDVRQVAALDEQQNSSRDAIVAFHLVKLDNLRRLDIGCGRRLPPVHRRCDGRTTASAVRLHANDVPRLHPQRIDPRELDAQQARADRGLGW